MRQNQRDALFAQAHSILGTTQSIEVCARKHNLGFCLSEIKLIESSINRMKEYINGVRTES